MPFQQSGRAVISAARPPLSQVGLPGRTSSRGCARTTPPEGPGVSAGPGRPKRGGSRRGCQARGGEGWGARPASRAERARAQTKTSPSRARPREQIGRDRSRPPIGEEGKQSPPIASGGAAPLVRPRPGPAPPGGRYRSLPAAAPTAGPAPGPPPPPPPPRPRPPPGPAPPRPPPARRRRRPPPTPAPAPTTPLTAGHCPLLPARERPDPLPGHCAGGVRAAGLHFPSHEKINHQKIIPEKNGE